MSKDIRGYFSSSSKSSSVAVAGSKDISNSDSEDSDIEPVTKKPCHSASKIHPTSSSSKKRHYLKRWETEFEWLEYDEDLQGAFCKYCKKWAMASNKTGGAWITKPFNNWKKAVAKMKDHAESEGHIHACQIETSSATALLRGSIAQQLQQVQESERLRNRAAIKSLLRCTHFLAHQHIAHTTNFSELVDLVVSCGGEDFRHFLEKPGKNATYTSKDAVVDFVETIGLWVEECLLKRLCQAQYFSLLADECTDISTIEELSVVVRWVEDGLPVEHFIELVPLKKADANTIYENLIDCLKKKGLMVSNMIGMGFDGAATFSGKHNGVQSLLNRNSPHSIFVHCHCHLLQLACVQAANGTQGIKHVYTTLTTLWKYFHYSPKRAECLREIQQVLDMPEFKIVKPSDTRWLAHERCVKVVKENYCAIVIALNNIYEETHEPEALGISKALSKKSTISAMFLLDYVLPQVAKLSRTLQTEKLDITIISSLVEATLHTIDDVLTPAANWVLALRDMEESLDKNISIKITIDDIKSFQDNVGIPFVSKLKINISSRFSSQDVVSAFSIFDPKKIPKLDSSEYTNYGNHSLSALLNQYGSPRTAIALDGEEVQKPALITDGVHAEWTTFRHYIAKEPKEDMSSQLKNLLTNDMLKTMFPNLHTLANVCMTLPVGTASVERSFSQMKMIKTRPRNRLGEKSLSYLMKISIESPQKLTDEDLETMIEIWSRKTRRIVV